jgi:hypothetical protein
MSTMNNDDSPTVLSLEHKEMQEDLARATRAGGETERAAWQVTRVLFPHVYREEEFAMPPLLLLPRLARGEVTPDMESVLAKTEIMKAELPRMLAEHKAIVTALRKLLQAATAEGHPGFASFAQKLIQHAQMEEEVLYPASILVGEYLKLRLGRA